MALGSTDLEAAADSAWASSGRLEAPTPRLPSAAWVTVMVPASLENPPMEPANSRLPSVDREGTMADHPEACLVPRFLLQAYSISTFC